MRLVPLVLVMLVAVTSCEPAELPPQGQIVLYVDTDAIVPTEAEPARRAFFDSLRLDLLLPGEDTPCATCSRTFQVTTERFRKRMVSFGVASKPGQTGYRVRARLYPSWATFTGVVPELPDGTPPTSVIDVTVSLPPVAVDGVIERAVVLRTESVGLPEGSPAAPIEARSGKPATSLVGTWPGAATVPCAVDPEPGEVCVPGGAFWMGSVLEAAISADRLRLVVLSPFLLDATEVKVSKFRAAGFTTYTWTKDPKGDGDRDYCTFTTLPDVREDFPVTCLNGGKPTAVKYCNKSGRSLPSEAQFEYVASGMRGAVFVWGNDTPSCEDAAFGRGGWGQYAFASSPCRPADPPGGPLPVGSGRRDRLDLDGSTIFDLTGNVGEILADAYQGQGEPCWAAGGVYRDPICTDDIHGLSVSRGGTWLGTPNAAHAAFRESGNSIGASPRIGFRCARPGL